MIAILRTGEEPLISAKDILTNILQTEEELKQFCETNHIQTKNQHIFSLVIEAFILLTKKIEYQQGMAYS